jgi:hypothetical protein
MSSLRHSALAFAVLTVAAPADGQTVSDFSLQDMNLNSNRNRATSAFVSPRNYLHQVTAWYFGHEG